jgi:hypothetical protein
MAAATQLSIPTQTQAAMLTATQAAFETQTRAVLNASQTALALTPSVTLTSTPIPSATLIPTAYTDVTDCGGLPVIVYAHRIVMGIGGSVATEQEVRIPAKSIGCSGACRSAIPAISIT